MYPSQVPCCIGTPRWAVVAERVQLLAWLCLISGYCLLGDAANNGYLLLRAPDGQRSAVALLRAGRATADPRRDEEAEEAADHVPLIREGVQQRHRPRADV